MRKFLYIFLFLLLAACSGNETAATPSQAPTQERLQEHTRPAVTSPAATQTTVAEETQAPSATGTLLEATTASPETAAAPTPGFADAGALEWQPVASGLQAPIGLTHAGDGTGRLFVVEQAGRIQIIREGSIIEQPFLDIVDRVGSEGSEQGLLGLAFHPQYEQNGQFYVNYTDKGGNTVIARYQVDPANPDRAQPGSEQVLLNVEQPYGNHNGGVLAFGPDGYLYIGLGDGGSGGDPQGNGQSLDTLLGKILRIDVNSGDPYSIPADNPFAGSGGRPEIWAYGLRNPWRLSFDRQTGDLYIGDVGQGTFEEVDFQEAGAAGGANYGWNIMEGFECFNAQNCNREGLTQPVFTYPTHVEGTCSVTGGYVYRGENLSEWQGVYFSGDFCSGRVWGLKRNSEGAWEYQVIFPNGGRITSFGEDETGELYLVDYSGTIYTLTKK